MVIKVIFLLPMSVFGPLMSNRFPVSQPFPTVSGNSTDKTGLTVSPFPPFRGERETEKQSPLGATYE